MAIVKSTTTGIRNTRLGVGDPSSSSCDEASSMSGDGPARTDDDSSSSGSSDCSDDVSEVDSGMESDDHDYAGLGEAGTEFCQIGDQSCLLPYELYDLTDLTGVLSLDSWNNCLTEEDRFVLAEYLPDMDQETFMLTLRDLFTGNNFLFGSPMARLFEQLKGGQCEPRVALYRQGLNHLLRREHYYQVAEYHNSMVCSLVEMRELWESCARYGIEERLHVLNSHRSSKKLGYVERNRVSSRVESESEKFMAKWNKKLSNIGRSSDALVTPVSYRGHLQEEEPNKYWKEQPKGTLKVASSKTKKELAGSSAKAGSGVSLYSRRTPPLGPSHLNRSAVFDYDYGGIARSRDRLRKFYGEEYDDRGAYEEDYEMRNFKPKAKHGKEQQRFKRRRDQSPPFDYGAEEAQDYSGSSFFSRKKDAGQVLFVAPGDSRLAKKSRHVDMDRGGSTRVNPEHLALRGECADSPDRCLHSRKVNILKEELSVGRVDRYSERIGKKKLSEKEDLNIYPKKSASHAYSDRLSQSPVWNMRGKYFQNIDRDAEYVGAHSPFYRNEETDSDSSEAEEEDTLSTRLKKIKQSNAIAEKHQKAMYGSMHDLTDAKKVVKSSKRSGSSLSQMPGEEVYQSTRHKNQTQVDSYTHGYSTKIPSPGKLADGQKYMYDMEEDMEVEEDNYGERPELPLAKNNSAGRMGMGPHLELAQPNMDNYLSGTMMENTDGVPDLIAGQVGISGNSKAEFDSNGQLCMPLTGCKSLATKRKLDRSKHQSSSSDKHADVSIPKKNGKKKTEECSPVITPDLVTPPIEAVAEPELQPSRKPFTLITPTVHTGFSFSIVHLLSAVRKAMITSTLEDTTEIGNVDSRNDNADANSTEGQKGIPSLTVQEIVNRVKSNPGDPCILETQEPLQDLVRGVLKIFSSKTAPLGAKAWKPLVTYEKSTKSWSWIGPLSPATSDPVEEETSPEAWDIPHKMLVKLVDAFANWLKSGQETLRKIGSLPPPPVILLPNLDEKERFKELRAQKSLNTISASPAEVKEYFRLEEFLRYQIPERAFSYTAADGKKSIVAPLRRGGGKPTSKARDHFMLKPDRPPHVTILCLVRDAAARLPGSIGTRADVCTLIRDSQYIVEDVSDSQVNQVVSGALDRLHYERDPCVQYDSDRKLWVYLHRDREEEDFEDDGTSSTKKWKRPKKDATENTDMGLVANADQFDGDQDAGGLAVFELNSDPNIDPSSTQMGEKSELLYSDIRPTDENVEPLKTPIQGSSHQGQQMPWDVLAMNPVQHGNQMLCQQNCTNEDFDDETFGRGRPVGLLNASLL